MLFHAQDARTPVNAILNRYRVFQRGWGVYYAFDNQTGNSQSLKTRDKGEAARLVHAMNEAVHMTHMNSQIARAYLTASDPQIAQRTWRFVIEEIIKLKVKGSASSTVGRWQNAAKDQALESLLPMTLLETRAEHVLKAIEAGTVSTNVFLRRIHNFAVGMGWLPWPLVPKKMWPTVVYQPKRGITLEEHERIIAREGNPERRDFYELCWHLGGSQSDVADLYAEDVDWSDWTVGYDRHKLQNRHASRIKPALIHFGQEVAQILKRRPECGPLFPYLHAAKTKDRATEFRQRCQSLGIEGVSLHSYRYAWAERARKCGFPLRFAQEALGHNSKAVHAAYASKAEVKVPSLDAWEKGMKEKLVEFKPAVAASLETEAPSAPVAAVS